MNEPLLLPSRAESFTYCSAYWLCPDCNLFVSMDTDCCKSTPSIAECNAACMGWESPSGKLFTYNRYGEVDFVWMKAVAA